MAKMPASMKPPDDFLFANPEGRPFRAISIETELDGPGGEVARSLNSCGIIASQHVLPYGSHPGPAHPHVAFLKSDSSVTCGEVVFDRIYLTNARHAKALRVAMEKMRQLEKQGKVAYNPNCGGHIHMDALGYGFYDVLRLMVNFGYLEEPIFRLAGAGKQYGHRSLYKGYDRAHNGRGYSNPVVKGPFTDPVLALSHFRAQQRNTGLNITKYMSTQCRTGRCEMMPIKVGDHMQDAEVEMRVQRWMRNYRADYGHAPTAADIEARRRAVRRSYGASHRGILDLKMCTCAHPQFTIEWRVWNSQGNPRVLYSWIALMQALHSYCWRPGDDPSYREHEHREPLGWERRPFDGADLAYLKKAQERLEFIFCELPLRDVEKDALAYSFMRTPYRVFGKDYFKRLAQMPYKAPPFPNEYKGIPVRKISDIEELAAMEVVADSPFMEAARRVLFDPMPSPHPNPVPRSESTSPQRERTTGQRPRLRRRGMDTPQEILRSWLDDPPRMFLTPTEVRNMYGPDVVPEYQVESVPELEPERYEE